MKSPAIQVWTSSRPCKMRLVYIFNLTDHADQNQEEASQEVDEAYPDPLREPVLRKVQHSTISRIDNLGKLFHYHEAESMLTFLRSRLGL